MNSISLSAQIKGQIFCQIFESLTKNMKQNQKIYFLFNQKQMKIGLRQNSKTTQMQLCLNNQTFKSYTCNTLNHNNKQYILRKFQLNKFLYFQTFFQTCKGLLKLQITQDTLTFTQYNGKKSSSFPVKAQYIDQQQVEILKKHGFMRIRQQFDQEYCHLEFSKGKQLQEIIKAGNTMKIDKIYLSYKPNQKKLKFDLIKNNKCYFKLKVYKEISTKGTPVTNVTFPFRKLKLAVGLLQAEKAFEMILDKQMLVIEFKEQDKKQFNITLCAEIQGIDQIQ